MRDGRSGPGSVFSAFRALLHAPELSFLMEAHNGLSARVVEEAGFEGIWASGLSIATAFGVRDRGEASWTQVLDVLDFMADAVEIPILVDADTGFGDFNVFRRVVRKLCQRRIAAVCIEDQSFPKTNSLLDAGHGLADIDEFCGKIKAGKDSQTETDFSIVARVEALIAGRGMAEALTRAGAYHAAGADAILIHSRKTTAEEVLTFAREWAGRCPLVIVPTMYHRTPTQAFRDAGLSMVIWANHNLRAALAAMRDTSARIRAEQSLVGVEGSIASLADVFALTDIGELDAADKRYMPRARREVTALVLAATRGEPLGELTADKPKCMLDIRGEPILARLVRTLRGHGVADITVVAGYRPEAITVPGIRITLNPDYAHTGELASLGAARDGLGRSDALVIFGDVIFREHLVRQLLTLEGEVLIVVDSAVSGPGPADLVECEAACTPDHLIYDQTVGLVRIGPAERLGRSHGQWVGLAKFSAAAGAEAVAVLDDMDRENRMREASMSDLLNALVARGVAVRVVYTAGDWLDVNDAFGLAKARNFL